jgi:serine/threonine protein kinase
MTKPCDKILGTSAYMAPEVHSARTSPFKGETADIFSLGVMFFTIAFGAPPFHVANKTDLHFRYNAMKPGNHDFFKFHPNTR